MKVAESREELLGSGTESARASQHDLRVADHVLTSQEKTFLLHAERGDCATVRSLLEEYRDQPAVLEINCVDPLNRSALIAAIENENIELIRLLLEAGIKVKDALLHSIKEEYVEAVELLLQWEEEHHIPGDPYSWEAVDRSCSTFTPDITPLILAAHRNHYEILKILLDRGATLPMPHDVRCGCDECVVSSARDSLRHSQARINAYRALTAPSLIALSSPDPVLTAFQLSWELRRLSRMETEFRAEYNELRAQCQGFATALLDHARTSNELEIMLNYNPSDTDVWDPGERQTLDRLKLAIKYKQKMFVAHPNVQQLLGAIWYEGLPGFRRKNMMGQLVQVMKLGAMFPVYSSIYMMAPNSKWGQFMKKPFVKFICHSTSYAFFLLLLGLASQRAEYLVLEWFGNPWMLSILEGWKRRERGAMPGIIEFSVIIYIISLVWSEIRSLWSGGVLEYINDLWNIVDFITNVFYIAWISLRFASWYIVQRDAGKGLDPWYPRERWDPYDPMLLSEGAFAAGMVFSYMKLVHIFSINPHLGPLQVSLGRMIIDIIKFFFIYTLVLFAFGCGLNQLMWYYADLEKSKCFHHPNGLPDFDGQEKACSIWRRYINLFETSQSLFWASFGLVDLTAFDLTGIKSFTRFWALLMFGSYSVINIIVLLNMLIAMMSNSYQIISERSDVEWKFARTNLWMSYFEDGDTVPPPFNLIPTPKNMCKILVWRSRRNTNSILRKSHEKALVRHETVMRQLVRRYVTAEQRKRDEFGVTEDDVMEIRQDISTLRYELIDILHKNGMQTPRVDKHDTNVPGKKGRVMERRLLKDFQIGIVEGIVNEVLASEQEPKDVFSQIAKAIGRRSVNNGKNRDWNALVRKNTSKGDPIGTRSEALLRRSRQSLRQHILENIDTTSSMDTEKLVEYNPKLSEVTPTTRVAYAKFMKRKLKSDYNIREERAKSDDYSSSFALEDEVVESTTEPPVIRLRPKSKKIVGDEQKGKDSEKEDPSIDKKGEPVEKSCIAPAVEKDFRSRTPIQEMSDEELDMKEGAKDLRVHADVETQQRDDISESGSLSTSALTRPLKSWSREPSEAGSDSTHPPSPPPASRGTPSPFVSSHHPESYPTSPKSTDSYPKSDTSKSSSPEITEEEKQQIKTLPASQKSGSASEETKPLGQHSQPVISPPSPKSSIPSSPEPGASAGPVEVPALIPTTVLTPPEADTSARSSPIRSLTPGRGKSKATGKQVSGWI